MYTIDLFKKTTSDTLKNIFRLRIEQNFLIEILNDVLRKLNFSIRKYFDAVINPVSIVSGSTEAVAFEICKNIIGIHRSNLIFLNDEECVSLENDQKYRKQLVDDVISQIKLRGYAGRYFRKFPLASGDEFIYYPLAYYEFVISYYSELLLLKHQKCKYFGLYSAIFNKSLSALSLLENNLLDNAYPICRGAIELFLKLLCFHSNNKNISDEYDKFVEFQVDKECCANKRKKEFKILFKNRINKKCGNLNDYLHYGWVDKINNYHKIVKNNPYTFNGLLTYLLKITKMDQLNALKRFYKICNTFTHGNVVMSKYRLLYYFEISLILGIVIKSTFNILINDLSASSIIENIDILQKIILELDKTIIQYNNKSTKNFENYYSQKFNKY